LTPATAQNLSDLHLLHQRARALRDRMASGPKTLAARQLALANRQAELEQAKKTLQDSKLQLKKHEHSIQGVDTKIDDLKVKLNLVKKNDEYKALQNQIATKTRPNRRSKKRCSWRSRRSK
jgi:predicted  nucleic acid-binding Zn-ribbon protein